VADRRRWAGATSQLFLTIWDGFLRGRPSLVIDLFAAGDSYVCGSGDGFHAFFESFVQAFVRDDLSALSAMMDYPIRDETDACDGSVASPAEFVRRCRPLLAAKNAIRRARPICNVSEALYW